MTLIPYQEPIQCFILCEESKIENGFCHCFNRIQNKEINNNNINTKEYILNQVFEEHGIRKGWIEESKLAVLDAMDKYANKKLNLYKNKQKYMGQHTWFLKSKELFLKQNELYNKLDKFERNEIYLDDLELLQINTEIDEIEEKNDTEYHDLFRTPKRNLNKTYTDDVIFSKEECFEWINKPENLVSFKNSIFDTDKQEKINREYSINQLNEFWNKYPNGVIHFG